jgi:hypothetical protein
LEDLVDHVVAEPRFRNDVIDEGSEREEDSKQ